MSTSPGDLRDAVETLLYTYADAVDRGDLDLLAKLFATGRIRFPDVAAEGGDAVRELYATRLGGAPLTRHLISNVRVEAGPGATGDTRATAAACTYVRLGVVPPSVLSVGDYVALVRLLEDGTCRFEELTIRTLWAAPA